MASYTCPSCGAPYSGKRCRSCNYEHFSELEARYEEAKANVEAALQAQLEEQKRLDEEKAAAKAAKKNSK